MDAGSASGAPARHQVCLLVAFVATALIAGEAHAIVRGHSAGAIGRHVVRLIGNNLLCSATVIGRQEVLTSAHCMDGSYPYYVVAGGQHIAVTRHSGYAGAARLTLARPLPGGYVPIAIDSGGGSGTFTIAGYGVAAETARLNSGGLRAATLVSSEGGALVDPARRGEVGASACMGDSGGPVARFDGRQLVLVGIIERASHPSPTRACGHLTHFVSVGGSWSPSPAISSGEAAAPRPHRPTKIRKRGKTRRR